MTTTTANLRVVYPPPPRSPPCKSVSPALQSPSPSAPHVRAPSPSRRTSKAMPNSSLAQPLPPRTPPPHGFPKRREHLACTQCIPIDASATGTTLRTKEQREAHLVVKEGEVGVSAVSPALARTKEPLEGGRDSCARGPPSPCAIRRISAAFEGRPSAADRRRVVSCKG